MKTIICDFCMQPIAQVDLDTLTLPLTPDQFKSVMPEHDVPPPFHPSLEWKHFKCPFCHYRPFMEPDKIMVLDDNGFAESHTILPAPEHVCPKCGKPYRHKQSLNRHIKDCDA